MIHLIWKMKVLHRTFMINECVPGEAILWSLRDMLSGRQEGIEMLSGMESMFDDLDYMLKKLKKNSYEERFHSFTEKNGGYFTEMKEYVKKADQKEAAAEETAAMFVGRVQDAFAKKNGKVPSRAQADLDFFMIYYVFPAMIMDGEENSRMLADALCGSWNRILNRNIQYTDYDSLYHSFRQKILGIF